MTPVSIARAVGIFVLSSGFAALGAQQQPVNLGFEDTWMGSRPYGWGVAGRGFELVLDSTVKFAGHLSLRSRWVATTPYSEASQAFGVASQSFPVSAAAGRKLHLAGFIRTESIQNGYAGFWMRVDGPGGAVLAFDNMYQ